MRPIHREYLDYQSQHYIVTVYGESPAPEPQDVRAVIESVTPDKPYKSKPLEANGRLDSLLPTIRHWVFSLIDPRHEGEKGTWGKFTLAKNPDGTLRGTSIRVLLPMRCLIGLDGIRVATRQLETGEQAEIVAACGGQENAMAVLAYCIKNPPTS